MICSIVYRPIDLHIMESKADCSKYEHLEEFRADIQTIVHNVVIFHGGKLSSFLMVLLFWLNLIEVRTFIFLSLLQCTVTWRIWHDSCYAIAIAIYKKYSSVGFVTSTQTIKRCVIGSSNRVNLLMNSFMPGRKDIHIGLLRLDLIFF